MTTLAHSTPKDPSPQASSSLVSRLSRRILATDAGWSTLALRAPIGLVFAAHGAQKLFGWFGGYGLEGTGQWLASIGITPGYLMALMAGGAEFFGGLALIAGLLVRPRGRSTGIHHAGCHFRGARRQWAVHEQQWL